MKRSRYTEEQVIAVLKEVDAGAKLQDVVRRLGVTEQTYYRWKAKYRGMEVSDAKKLRALEDPRTGCAAFMARSRWSGGRPRTWSRRPSADQGRVLTVLAGGRALSPALSTSREKEIRSAGMKPRISLPRSVASKQLQ